MIKIRIVSPAKSISSSLIDYAFNYLKDNEFDVSIGKNATRTFHYFAGTDKERLEDLQTALDDENLNAILCARGGYGVVRLIDELDFTKFLKKPKMILGFSDVTVLHSHIFGNYGIPTVHCTAPLNFNENTEEALQSLKDVLQNRPLNYLLPPHQLNVFGEAKVKVIGGNLSILYSLIGTNSDQDYDDKILFIEEIGEAIYAIDRMLYSLKKAGKFKKLKGVIVGGMTNIKDSEIPFGKSVEEVIYDHFSNMSIPLCFNFTAGHIPDNRAIVLGKEAILTIDVNGTVFKQ